MIELVLVYCLRAQEGVCVERRDTLRDWGTPLQCMMQAQQQAQQYLADHPKWYLARWRCEVNEPPEQPA